MARTHAEAPRKEDAAATATLERPRIARGLTPERVLALQRTAGNQAVMRAVRGPDTHAPHACERMKEETKERRISAPVEQTRAASPPNVPIPHVFRPLL